MIGQFKGTDHFEIITSDDAERPYHVRIQNDGNNELEWTTQQYRDEDSPADAIGHLCSLFSPVGKVSVYYTHVEVWLDDDELGMKLRIDIEHVDARTPQADADAAEAPTGE